MASNGTAASPPCPKTLPATSNGSWQGDNPLDHALPLAILQICLVLVVTRSLAFLFRPIRQPRVIAEIIGGVLLGPSALGRSKTFLNNVFPKQSLTVLDTLANIGLLFFLFLIGLELDLKAIRRTGKPALAIAVAGISFPFALGVGTSFIFHSTVSKDARQIPFLVFMGVALSITAFAVLARILAELKLLTTDIGRMAMSAAAFNDVIAWVLLALAIALSGSGSPLVTLWVLLSGIAFLIFSVVAIRPALAWMAKGSQEGEPVKELYICATLATVLAAGFITDAIGIHALFGAFVVGIYVPKDGPFGRVMIEKIEDLVTSLFLPLYFVSSGLKTNVATISSGQSWGLVVLVITTACVGKILGTILVALLVKIPCREAVTLGFLMNTKGLVELIVLNIGKDRKVLNDETFTIMVLMALFTTFITTPIVMAIYKPARSATSYKHRTIERNDTQSELRMLACFRGNSNISTLVNLIESSRGIRRHGLIVYALHLMEFSERSSAIYTVHRTRRNGLPFWNKTDNSGNKDHYVVAFETFERLSHVSVRPMTCISELQTMHEDILASAQQKRAALIVLPFHKTMQPDGTFQSFGRAYQQINQLVLERAPCSVGILIDRGFGGRAQILASDVSYGIGVIFFGGADDREALAYGASMAEHPGIALVVFRLSLLHSQVSITLDETDRAADDAAIAAVRASNESIRFQESEVQTQAEFVTAIKDLGKCNLVLVGRSTPTMGSRASLDCPELGPVGSYLATNEFSSTTSVLVLQQYDTADNWGADSAGSVYRFG
ncbi:cation/H(+) antiporter 19-like [Dioscorea cayenensis subsp. rotundata]|uniref:Cation/H(+) antiporter 19-like n=1 Tax=Dioscorea cayennensis subsp. rotundata TaxID=55577 RepID=A0AB40D5B1_DIOCR|nr:cation/H(+) antiporter 19-like [Dioscorea cayenensis subsp. rotundata]